MMWRQLAAACAAAVSLAGCGATQVLSDVGPSRPTTTAGAATSRAATAMTTDTDRVARVVDGDTVELASGATVRMLGIDTPERGQCGYAAAADHLRDLVTGQSVILSGSAKKDRYGRLVRYVDVRMGAAVVDPGLALIETGLANARYDSRDGYGAHPREAVYVAADAATAHRCPALDGAS